MTEQERLADRLFGGETPAKNFRVTWGPSAHLMTAEQRAKAISDSLDDMGELVLSVDEWEAR